MYSDRDIIVAPATSVTQRSPLAILRVSGEGCWALVGLFFKGKSLQPWRIVYGDWCDEEGVLDDVMVTAFAAPLSYTGQEMVEICCHGNPLFVEAIERDLVSKGARRARPGEFTIRAVLNGKMDLLRAESVSGLIEANTRFQADMVRRQSRGPLVGFVKGLVEEILQIQAHIEATIDYGEEDIDALDRSHLLKRIDGLLVQFQRLHETGRFSCAMRRGFRVLITGEPNVGKSTLFNRLVREERAIVTHLPGTTRDLISEEIEIGGLPVVLIDSAGVRETDDVIESMGIGKIFAMLEDVDLVLYLTTSVDQKPPYEQLAELPRHKWLTIVTKSDLAPLPEGLGLGVSAATGAGFHELENQIVLHLSSAMAGMSVYLINQRQESLVGNVIAQLSAARNDYAEGFGEEVLTSYLNMARHDLGELTGETTVEDILDRMFSNFCLGK